MRTDHPRAISTPADDNPLPQGIGTLDAAPTATLT
jgi:hypothetical protein